MGSEYATASVAGTWTGEQSEALLAAFDDITAALDSGEGKLSRSVNGDERIVIAVGMDWGEPVVWSRQDWTAAYDLETLIWDNDPPKPWYYSCHVDDGGADRTVEFGPAVAAVGLLEDMKAFLENRVAAGHMALEQADEAYQDFWASFQQGDMPQSWQLDPAGK